jgi:hypothetical protein
MYPRSCIKLAAWLIRQLLVRSFPENLPPVAHPDLISPPVVLRACSGFADAPPDRLRNAHMCRSLNDGGG